MAEVRQLPPTEQERVLAPFADAMAETFQKLKLPFQWPSVRLMDEDLPSLTFDPGPLTIDQLERVVDGFMKHQRREQRINRWLSIAGLLLGLVAAVAAIVAAVGSLT